METIQYLRAFARSWWLILLTVIAGGTGGYLAYQGETPLYKSSIRMIVATTTNGLDEVAARTISGQRAEVLAQVAPTPPALQDAISAANVAGQASRISSSASANGPFVIVSVVSSNGTVSAAIANAYADTLEASTLRLAGPTSTPLKLTALAPAPAALHPFAPKPRHDVSLGLAAGLVLGCALAILRQTFNTSVRDSGELRELTQLTILGTVPRDLPKKTLPAATDPRSARAEGYRQIRTTLQNLNIEGTSESQPLKLSVTSATLGEGKTSVSTNLAVVFSRAGHRVALIDADLRRPQVAGYFGIESKVGLTEVLTRQVKLADALHVFDDGRLAVLASGAIAKNPSELLGSDRLEAVLDELGKSYDIIIVDTPPVLPVTDALVVAPVVDGVILVVRLERTTRNRVEHAIEAIHRVNGRLIGVVPNQAGKGRDIDYSYPYRYAASRRGSKRGQNVTPYSSIAIDAPPTIDAEIIDERPAPSSRADAAPRHASTDEH